MAPLLQQDPGLDPELLMLEGGSVAQAWIHAGSAAASWPTEPSSKSMLGMNRLD